MRDGVWETWKAAARADSKIKLRRRHLPGIERLQVHPEPYSRRALFSKICAGVPVLFDDFQLPVTTRNGESPAEAVERLLHTAFVDAETARVQLGPSRTRTRLRIPEIMARWARRRALVSVIDFHIRGSALESSLGLETLSDFNVLLTGSELMAEQEMMTVVIGAAGNVTPSHTDDPDGSNYCFTGRKFWLVWDSFEGSAAGIQDDARDECPRGPHFDLDIFLTLKSAAWTTVSQGQTLFLPGNMTHRVITLEHYLGVGSFYTTLPDGIQTIARWHTHPPLWTKRGNATAGLIDEIARAITARIRLLRDANEAERERWGLPFVPRALQQWERNTTAEEQQRLLANRDFAELIEAARAVDSRA